MGNPLQDRRTATEWALSQQVIEIADKIGSFEGLAAIVEDDLLALGADKMPGGWRDSVVAGRLQFGFADTGGRLPAMTGSATTDVDAVCQRCMQPFRLTLGVAPKLLLLDTQEVADEYGDFEVWELGQQTLRPRDIIEELLIMAMPLSAMHDNMAECQAFSTEDESAEDIVATDLKRPFAALRSQMQQNETDPDE